MTMLARLFGEGFRIFFLAAGLFALFTPIVGEGGLGVPAPWGMVSLTPLAPAPPLVWGLLDAVE